MKKILYSLSVLAISMGFAACDSFELPNPEPVVNPEEPAFNIDNLVVTPSQLTGTVSLSELNSSFANLDLAQYQLENWPTNYTLVPTMHMSLTDDFAKEVTTTVEALDGKFYLSPDNFQEAYNGLTLDPGAKDVYYYFTYAAKLDSADGSVILGGPDYRSETFKLNIKPLDPSQVIEDVYYLVVKGKQPVKLNHSDVSPYDDPHFEVLVNVTVAEAAAGYQWAIVPQSALNGGIAYYGSSLKGDFVEGTNGENYGTIKLDGPVMFSVDMRQLSYQIYNAYDYLYTPGQLNGSNAGSSQMLMTDDYILYKGFIGAEGWFLLSADLNNAKTWGRGAKVGELALGDKHITVSKAGTYFVTANFDAMTYKATVIRSIGLIGDATPGGWDAETQLTMVNPTTWQGTMKLNGGSTQFKFRMNNSWDDLSFGDAKINMSLGGTPDNLTLGGDNMASPEEGTYEITLHLDTLPYTCTLVKK